MEITIGIIALLVGAVGTWIVYGKVLKSQSHKILREAESEAEVLRKDKILQAKEKFLQLKSDHEKEINNRNAKLLIVENKLKQREAVFSQKLEELAR